MPNENFLHELAGSMSQGAAGNPRVAMIEAAFCHHGLHWRYVNTEVTPGALGDAVRGAKAMGFRGFNLSIPHKVPVIQFLDGLGMLVNQGVIGIQYWTGIEPDAAVMRRSLEEIFAG